jgi:hypothetical protein
MTEEQEKEFRHLAGVAFWRTSHASDWSDLSDPDQKAIADAMKAAYNLAVTKCAETATAEYSVSTGGTGYGLEETINSPQATVSMHSILKNIIP